MRWLIGAAALVVGIALLSIAIGSVFIPPLVTIQILLSRLLPVVPNWPPTFETILFDIRLPRVALVALSGAALSCSGAAYQGLFRNPLADPYLTGVSSGAGLGAMTALVLRLSYPSLWTISIPLMAFGTALLTVVVVYLLARRAGATPTTTLILAGTAVSAFTGSITTFLILRAGRQALNAISFLLGGFSSAGWEAVTATLPFVVVGFGLMYLYARPLNVLLFDEEQAQQLGIHVERVKLIVIVAATMTTAAAVSFNGLIGFIGLIIPHAMRLVSGPDHRRLLPLSALGGAGFLMLADLVARTVIAPAELPLGVVTAFAGAPFFLYLLRRAKHAAFF